MLPNIVFYQLYMADDFGNWHAFGGQFRSREGAEQSLAACTRGTVPEWRARWRIGEITLYQLVEKYPRARDYLYEIAEQMIGKCPVCGGTGYNRDEMQAWDMPADVPECSHCKRVRDVLESGAVATPSTD